MCLVIPHNAPPRGRMIRRGEEARDKTIDKALGRDIKRGLLWTAAEVAAEASACDSAPARCTVGGYSRVDAEGGSCDDHESRWRPSHDH